jgi:hypothetical protein
VGRIQTKQKIIATEMVGLEIPIWQNDYRNLLVQNNGERITGGTPGMVERTMRGNFE